MICPGCEGKNRDGARFCTFCGENLALRCLVCDAELIPEARFCDSCGAAVGADVQTGTPVVAARKVVTVLFADLTGSTALEEHMDAESVRSILDRFYAAMRAEVERHGGRVVKFTGDGVMAAFGVPEVHEDDAARAVDAALAMRNELEQLASDLSLDLSLKIGINTGEVVVSAADDDVVGDSVNVASRLEGAATSGEVLVGEDTWRLTRSTSRYESVPPLTLKGKTEPVPAYRLLAVDERTAEAATAPFVGRDAELRKLLQVFEEAVEANAARLVTIVGSPGLGKTRLARELMAELSEQATVRETRCDPAGSATFAPIADALRAATGITETSTEEEIVAILAAAFPEDDPDRDRIATRAAAILGAGQPGSTEETFWALRRLIEAAARNQPVVIVLDDMHWAEPLLLDFVEHVTEWIRDAPVLFVGTGRPEIRDMRPSLVEGGRAAAVISLEGLNQDATTQLALNLLGADDLPGELLAKIPASTEGNPLFVRELVRMLVDDGVLLRTADGWTVTVDVEAIQVPPTIQSLLSARVDRLRGDERAVMELASVVGKEFYRGTLIDLAPANVRDLVDGVLESLRRKELVEPVGTYWIDEPVFRFHHVLIRDAAYRRLLKESRADLHERVAEWLEVKTADVLGEHDELIGYHLEQAHDYKKQLGRPDVALGRRAAALLGTAASRALDSDDLPAAAALSGRALDCLPEDDEGRADLLIVRCEALLSIGDVSAGTLAVTQLESVANTPRLNAWATCFAGQLANLTSSERLHETEERVASAAAELAALGDQAGAAKANTVRAAALAALGRFADCEDVLDEAKNAAQAAKNNRLITATLGALPHVALWGPNPVSRAGGRCLDTIRLLRITTGSQAVEEMSRRCQAVLEALRGRSDAARGMLRRARRTLMELGLEHELLETELLEGIVELVSRDPAAAIEHLRSAHDGFRATGVDVLAAQSAALLARAHLALGEDDEAESFVGTSEHLGAQDLKTAIAWRSVRAELLAHRGEFDEGRRLADEAVELASRTDALVDQGDAYRSLAAVCAAAGDATGARTANERASEMYERKGATALVEAQSVTPATRHPEIQRPAEQMTATESLANPTTRLVVRWQAAYNARDWDEVARCCAADIVFDQRRPLFTERKVGIASQLAIMKQVADELDANNTNNIVAIRGEKLCLTRQTFYPRDSGRGGFDYELLVLIESNPEGVVAANVYFETDDLDSAFTELDARFVSGEGAVHKREVQATSKLSRAANARDWDVLEGILTDDCAMVDHRPATFGEIDRDTWLSSVIAMADLYPFRVDFLDYNALEADRVLVRALIHGQTDEGVRVENPFHMILKFRGEQIERMEPFSIEELDEARARFEELAATTTRELTNASVVAFDRMTAASVAEDWDQLRRLVTEDVVVEDCRPGMRFEYVGPDAVVEGAMSMNSVSARLLRRDVLAVRGDRLSLHRSFVGGPDPESRFEDDLLSVDEIDEEGLVRHRWIFESTDLDAAFAELDERFISGQGAAFAEVLRVGLRFISAVNSRDWEAMQTLLTGDVAIRDHRRAGAGDMGADPFVQSADLLTGPAGSFRTGFIREIALAPTLALVEALTTGTTEEGVAFEIPSLALVTCREDHLTRIELFEVDQRDQALARFEELRAEKDVAGPAPNQCALVMERVVELIQKGEGDTEVGRLYAPSYELEDRRRVLGAHADTDDALRGLGYSAMEPRSTRLVLLATRGEELAMHRITIEIDDFEIAFLGVNGIDNEGRLNGAVLFDSDNLDAAFAELDERFVAGEGAPSEEVLRLGLRLLAASNSRDWDAIRTLLAEDVVINDHRRTGLGEIGADPWVLGNQDLTTRLSASLRTDFTREIALAPTLALVEASSTGTLEDGGAFELPVLALVARRDDQITRIELFEVDQRDQALALFEELSAERDDSPGGLPDNLATRIRARIWAYAEGGEWDKYREAMSDDPIYDDRRQGVGIVLRGRETLIANARSVVQVGATVWETVPIAVRGERLSLSRDTFKSADPLLEFQVTALGVMEVDEQGRAHASVLFDEDNLDAAFAELEARHAALTRADELGRGKPEPPVLENAASRVHGEHLELSQRAEWDALAASHAEDAVVEDRRQGFGWRIEGRNRCVEHSRVATVGSQFESELLAVRGDRLALSRLLTTTKDFEVEILVLNELNEAGLQLLTVMFDADDLDAAFEELDTHFLADEGAPYAEVVELFARMTGAANKRDWDVYRETLAQDLTVVDHRPASLGERRGREVFTEWTRGLVDLTAKLKTYVAMYHELTTGSAVADVHQRGATPDGSDIEMRLIGVSLVNEGRLARIEYFDTEQIGAALSRFRELSRVSTSSAGLLAENRAVQFQKILQEALDQRDWSGAEAMTAEDVKYIDRRRGLGVELDGRSAMVEHWKIAVPGTLLREEVLATRGESLVLLRGTAVTRGAFEVHYIGLFEFNDRGKQTLAALYDIDDIDAAAAELDERFAAREGRECASAIRSGSRALAALNAQEWSALRALLTDDFLLVDHRPARLGELGPDGWIASLQALGSLTTSFRYVARRNLALTPTLVLSEIVTSGTTTDGAAIDISSFVLLEFRDEQICRNEVFPIDQADVALARFGELNRTSHPPSPQNRATRAVDRLRHR